MGDQRSVPNGVNDDFTGSECQRFTLTANTNKTFTAVGGAFRAVRISNFDLTNILAVRTDGVAVASMSDTSSKRVGVAPLANMCTKEWFIFTGTQIDVMSGGASSIDVEFYF